MSGDISYKRFVHGDTNILSEFAKRRELWRLLQDFLRCNDLCLAISGAPAAELSSATRLHESLNVLLTAVPSATIKGPDEVLKEEIDAYPSRRTDTLLRYPLNALLGKSDFGRFLSSRELVNARDGQRVAAGEWTQRVSSLQGNFSPSKNGKYTRKQADELAWILTIQELGTTHAALLTSFAANASRLIVKAFPSLQIMGYVVFYKYYLSGRKPKQNDFGDMFQLYDIPYCKFAILERDMCEVLNQIKRNHGILDGTVIANIDFLNDWKWVEEV